MQAIQHSYDQAYLSVPARQSLVARFFLWCKNQDHNRFGWLAVILTTHGCILTPITILAIYMSGINLVLVMLAMTAMAISLVSNLAAMPTRITIPVYFLSVLMDVAIMVISLT